MESFTPPTSQPPPPPAATRPSSLPLASLICGIFALFFGLFIIGALPALIGLILGIIHLRRAGDRSPRAWVGVALSTAGLLMALASTALVVWTVRSFKERGRSLEAHGESWQGKPAPDLTITTLDGRTFRLGDLRGRRVVINVWATWCGSCRQELPHFVAFARSGQAADTLVIGVSRERPEVLRQFVKEQGLTYPIASANLADWPEPFASVHLIPTTFFIDRNGLIQFIKVGYLTYDKLIVLGTAKDLKTKARPRAEAEGGT